jgi:hypothetical protein
MMIRLLLFTLTLSLHTFSQDVKRMIEKTYTSGQISVRETQYDLKNPYNFNQLEEKVEVFNRKGELVYTGYRRNYAGHSSIHLTFHSNGGVQRIDASSAPDGGIQWYKSRHELDEDGNVIHFSEQSHDDRVTLIQPTTWTVPPSEKPKQEVVECAVPMQTITKLSNQSKRTITVLVTLKNQPDKISEFRVKPKGELLIGESTNAQVFAHPENLYVVHIKPSKSSEFHKIDWKNSLVKQEDPRAQVRMYTLFWGL